MSPTGLRTVGGSEGTSTVTRKELVMLILLIVHLHEAIRLMTHGGWACFRLPYATPLGHYACIPHA